MPSGPTHVKFNLIFLLPALAGVYYLGRDPLLCFVFSASFLYSTFFASPDMDLAHQIKLFSWKGLFTLPFRLFYAPIVKHRSKISHSLLLGTPGRLLSIAVFCFFTAFIFLLVHQFWSASISQSEIINIWDSAIAGSLKALGELLELTFEYKTETITALAGFLLADLGHLLLDRFF